MVGPSVQVADSSNLEAAVDPSGVVDPYGLEADPFVQVSDPTIQA